MRSIFRRLMENSLMLFDSAENEGRYFHVSFILHGSKILTYGVNSYSNLHLAHRFGRYRALKNNNPTYLAGRHSEAEAVRKLESFMLNPEYRKLTLVNLRIDKNRMLAYSAPCENCFDNIVLPRRFRRIFFSVGPESFEKLKI